MNTLYNNASPFTTNCRLRAVVLFTVILACSQLSCFKDEPAIPTGIFNIPPGLEVKLESNTKSELRIQAEVTEQGNPLAIRYGFVWDEQQPEPDISLSTRIEYFSAVPHIFQDTIRDLKTGTEYYVRAFVEKQSGITYSPTRRMKTASWWTLKNAPDRYGTAFSVAFSIGDKGYFGTGVGFNQNNKPYYYDNTFWEYDPKTDVWTQRMSLINGLRGGAVGFSIGDKGYVGTGRVTPDSLEFDKLKFGFLLKEIGGESNNEFYEYDPALDIWTQKSDFPGPPRWRAFGFSIDGLGYIGGGLDTPFVTFNDFWQYDPSQDNFTQLPPYPGSYTNFSFSIDNKGYVGDIDEFYEYDPASKKWTSKTSLPGFYANNGLAVSYGMNHKGYVGFGFEEVTDIDVLVPASSKQFWEYDPVTGSWMRKEDLPKAISGAIGFSIGNKGYIGLGFDHNHEIYNNFWEYSEN